MIIDINIIKYPLTLQCMVSLFPQKHLTDEEEVVAKFVGCQLSDMANRYNSKLSNQQCERVLFETFSLIISQTGCQLMPVQVFRKALEMVQGQNSHWTYHSVLDVLFCGRKIFSQLLINFEGQDINGFRLIDQFVDFFNAHCLPWIRSHGGWVSNLVINCKSLTPV